jgi:hypothetical protein
MKTDSRGFGVENGRSPVKKDSSVSSVAHFYPFGQLNPSHESENLLEEERKGSKKVILG